MILKKNKGVLRTYLKSFLYFWQISTYLHRYIMSIEQSKEALLEQLEALKKENEQLRKELSTLRDWSCLEKKMSN